jgi:glutamine synthetase adenylyltransferase
MSAPGDCFAIALLAGLTGSLALWRRTVNIVLAVLDLIGLLQVAQTRQLTLAAMATALIIVWLLRPKWALTMGIAGAAAFVATILLRGPILFEQLADALLPNISEFFGSNLTERAHLIMETKLEQIAVKAVNQLPKSVIRAPRSVGAGGGRPPPATRCSG